MTAAARGGVELTVLYDRDCGFCQWSAERLRRWDRDGRLELLAAQAAASSGRPELVRAAAEHDLLEALAVVRRDGSVVSGGDAMLALTRVLPGGTLPSRLGALPWVRPIVSAGYDLVAANRYRISGWLGLDRCVIPSEARQEPPPRDAGRAA